MYMIYQKFSCKRIKIKMNANDITIYAIVNNVNDQKLIQNDLND